MDVMVKRDGIILRGIVENMPVDEPKPALILFHGFGGNLGYEEQDLYYKISKKVTKKGLMTVRFDFDGHGKSEGAFSDMDVLREILDGIEILRYVQSLPNVSEIYLLGHSQGGVVAGMLAGLYPDIIKKLILLAPGATLKSDACKGTCLGTPYDTDHIPDTLLVDGQHQMGGHYFRIAKNLPIYEVTAKYMGPALLIHGIYDACVDKQASVTYHERMPQSELKLYEHLDHGIEGEDQREVLEEIIGFCG